ncbi:hypothetical protein ANH9381_0790 [Aggregatibacter actinomycetemcomitans ANH9381]|nr:hypothetical protein ANH9381_0790 [Aggregatibacter actinomycetemcomitans ANH9381]
MTFNKIVICRVLLIDKFFSFMLVLSFIAILSENIQCNYYDCDNDCFAKYHFFT